MLRRLHKKHLHTRMNPVYAFTSILMLTSRSCLFPNCSVPFKFSTQITAMRVTCPVHLISLVVSATHRYAHSGGKPSVTALLKGKGKVPSRRMEEWKYSYCRFTPGERASEDGWVRSERCSRKNLPLPGNEPGQTPNCSSTCAKL
jgi:hypothetical protein